MRRILISLSSLFAFTGALFGASTAAFAARLNPAANDTSSVVPSVVHHSSGLAAWPVALIVVASLIVLAAVALAARFVGTHSGTSSRRHLPTPAAS